MKKLGIIDKIPRIIVAGHLGLYKLIGIYTRKRVKRKKKGLTNATLAAVAIIALVGGYISIILSKQAFNDDSYG